MSEIQICFKCKKEKPLNEFYKHKEAANGHLGKCKECAKKDSRDNYRENIQQKVMYDKLRNNKPERKALQLEYMRSRRKLNPDKYRANNKVSKAIWAGKLTKKPCELCGEQKTEAHHDDYSKPLEIRWLCRGCHLHIHGKQQRIAA